MPTLSTRLEALIFSHDQPSASAEVEATFSYPLGIVLEEVDRYLVVKFAEKHGIQGKLESEYSQELYSSPCMQLATP